MTDLIDTTQMYLRTVLELEEEGIPALRARIVERLDGTHRMLDTITSFLEDWIKLQASAIPTIRGVLLLDDIVGFITRGYGVSVHRADCPNADPARRKPEEEGRWIKVSWADDVEGTFRTTLQVVAKDRINLIMDISTVLSSTKTHVGSLNARSTPDGFALITLDTDISSSDQLKTVMRRIEQISGVMRVTRPAG